MVAVLDYPRFPNNQTEGSAPARPRSTTSPGANRDPVVFANRRFGRAWAAPLRLLVALAIAVAMVWLTVSTAMTMASWAVGVGEPTFAATDAPIIHLVEPGDTVWSVARLYQPSGDVRPFVDRLLELNGGSNIAIGQRLLVSP